MYSGTDILEFPSATSLNFALELQTQRNLEMRNQVHSSCLKLWKRSRILRSVCARVHVCMCVCVCVCVCACVCMRVYVRRGVFLHAFVSDRLDAMQLMCISQYDLHCNLNQHQEQSFDGTRRIHSLEDLRDHIDIRLRQGPNLKESRHHRTPAHRQY